MRNTIDISVIIPAYNADNYIEECMDSVLRQNDINIEILAVDDGSTDRTGEILDTYAERYDNVRILHKENGSTRLSQLRSMMERSTEEEPVT